MPIPGNVASLPVIGPWLTMQDQNQNVIPGQQLQQMQQAQALQQAMTNGPINADILRAKLDEHKAKIAKSQADAALMKQILGNEGGSQITPEKLDQIGQMLAVGGHPGAATVMNIADKRRAATADAATMGTLRSQGVPIARGVAPDEASAVAAINAGGGAPMSIGIGSPPPDGAATVQQGGLFAPYFDHPNKGIAQRAQFLQAALDKSPDKGSERWMQAAKELSAQASNFVQQTGMAQFRVDNPAPKSTPQAKVPVGYRMTADGNSMERIPLAGESSEASNDALIYDAYYSLVNGAPPGGSVATRGGPEGDLYRRQLREARSKIAKELGISPEVAATLPKENKAKFMALGALEKDLASIRPFDKMLETNANIAIDLAKKIERTDSAFLNKPITWLQANASDNADIAEYLFQIQTVATEGARILNNPRLVGQLTDSARTEMLAIINGNMPLGQTTRVLERMKLDGKNRVNAMVEEADNLKANVRGSLKNTSPKKDDIQSAVKAAGYPYEPDKYDYRVGINGKVQRKAK